MNCASIGNLLGTRMVLNEFVAFVDLGKIKPLLQPRSFVIATFALCGFANFSSIAIQIGGIGALAPSRKSDLAKLGVKAMIVGTLANFMSACIAGILLYLFVCLPIASTKYCATTSPKLFNPCSSFDKT